MRRHHGFSLIEILVAMVLLSMVVLVSSQAYSIFASKWDGRLGRFNQTLSEAKSLTLVQRAVDGIIPYVAFNAKDKPKLYFEGNRNGFVAVSNSPVFAPESAAVIRLQAEQLSDFTFMLTYQEWPMVSPLLKTDQPLAFGRKITLFTHQENILFRYFGWESAKAKNQNTGDIFAPPAQKEWFNEYNSLERELQPHKIAIMLSSERGEREFIYRLNEYESYQLSRYGDNL